MYFSFELFVYLFNAVLFNSMLFHSYMCRSVFSPFRKTCNLHWYFIYSIPYFNPSYLWLCKSVVFLPLPMYAICRICALISFFFLQLMMGVWRLFIKRVMVSWILSIQSRVLFMADRLPRNGCCSWKILRPIQLFIGVFSGVLRTE